MTVNRLLYVCVTLVPLLACGPSRSTESPLSPTTIGSATVQTTAVNGVNPVVWTQDRFASCLSGSADESCFTAAAVASSSATESSPFGDCLRGVAGPSCFATPRVTTLVAASLVAPAAPLSLAGNVSGTSVALTWSPPAAGDPATSYLIEAGTGPGQSNLAMLSTGSAAASFSASGVPSGTYYVRVRAANAGGTSPPSNEVVLQVGGPAGCGPLGTPTLNLVTNNGGTVGFAWTIPSGGPTAYILQAGSAPALSNLANLDLRQANPNFTTSGVPPGTYYVRVLARRNDCARSAPSNELVVTVGGPAAAEAIIEFSYELNCDDLSVETRVDDVSGHFFRVAPGEHRVTTCTGYGRPTNCTTVTVTLAPGERRLFTVTGGYC